MGTYINQTVFKASKLSHLAFEFNFILLPFCTLYWLLRMEEEKIHCLREEDTNRAPEVKVTGGHKAERVTLELSSARSERAVRFSMS